MSEPLFWVHVLPFELGCLLTTQSSSFDLASLLRFVAAIPQSSYPLISEQEWSVHAELTFRLTPGQAQALWQMFHVIAGAPASASVPVRQFAIYLHLQLFQAASAAKMSQRSMDSWPASAPPSTLDVSGGASSSLLLVDGSARSMQGISSTKTASAPAVHLSDGYNMEEGTAIGAGGSLSASIASLNLSPTRSAAFLQRHHLESNALLFVQRHLHDCLVLLSEDRSLPVKNLALLGFLLGASYDLKDGKSLSLSETVAKALLPAAPTTTAAASLNVAEVLSFISKHLGHNHVLYPRGSFSSVDAVSIHSQHRTAILRRGVSSSVRGKTVHVTCCNHCTIYIPEAIHHASIFGCVDCTIVLGAVQGIVAVEHCEKVTLTAACRAMRVAQSQDCKLYLLTNTKPVVLGPFIEDVYIGPYNCHYGALEQDLERAAIDPLRNEWNKFINLSSHVGPQPDFQDTEAVHGPVAAYSGQFTANAGPGSDTGGARVLRPAAFQPTTVPFDILPEGSGKKTVANPCPLPDDYVQDLRRRAALARELGEKMRVASTDRPERHDEIQLLLQQVFKDWLQQSGHIKALQDLLHADCQMDV